jgi:hypothetical protein
MLTLTGITIAGGSFALGGSAVANSFQPAGIQSSNQKELKDGTPSSIIVPNGSTLPWKIIDGVKVFHLVAEEVNHEFAPGLKV